MDKNKLIDIKRRLLALGLAGLVVGTAGCSFNDKDKNDIPGRVIISTDYSNVDDYCKYIIHNDEAVKIYNSSNVYLLFNKETYEVSEYLYYSNKMFDGLGIYIELYDLPSEEMLVYSDGIDTIYNEDYYNYLIENNYQVCLADASDYVEGHTSKEYYSLREIRELEPQIAKGLQIINDAKVKTK